VKGPLTPAPPQPSPLKSRGEGVTVEGTPSPRPSPLKSRGEGAGSAARVPFGAVSARDGFVTSLDGLNELGFENSKNRKKTEEGGEDQPKRLRTKGGHLLFWR
jgi:hypothetical protein